MLMAKHLLKQKLVINNVQIYFGREKLNKNYILKYIHKRLNKKLKYLRKNILSLKYASLIPTLTGCCVSFISWTSIGMSLYANIISPLPYSVAAKVNFLVGSSRRVIFSQNTLNFSPVNNIYSITNLQNLYSNGLFKAFLSSRSHLYTQCLRVKMLKKCLYI